MNTETLSVRVARKASAAFDISTFLLVAADGQGLPPFSAGAHIEVHVPGVGGRQYSLCNDPSECGQYLIAVLRDPASRGGSIAMHDSVKEGDLLKISAPRNHFPLSHEADHSLLIAGGIGITPLLCMAEYLQGNRAGFDLHYCTRSRERTAFLDRIVSSDFAQHSHFHFDDGEPEQRLDVQRLLRTSSAGTHLYVCGPTGFMDFLISSARDAGWPDSHVHREYFAGKLEILASDSAFDVRIASSGRLVHVPCGKTVLQALAGSGLLVPTSCEQGVCGTCITRVLDGIPDHRDLYLSSEEQAANDQFIPCCSRSKSSLLVLDL